VEVLVIIVSAVISSSVGTLKPVGQMSFAPPSSQTVVRNAPNESAFVQSLLPVIKVFVPGVMLLASVLVVAEVRDSCPSGLFRGLTYKLVTSPKTGRVWLDRNLGATQVATKVDDSAAYGDYYQWGRAKDGHQSSTLSGTPTPTQTPSSGIVPGNSKFIYGRADWTTTDSDGALRIAAWNDICPAGFSVPFLAELVLEATSVFTGP
jgi:hypothetical protein